MAIIERVNGTSTTGDAELGTIQCRRDKHIVEGIYVAGATGIAGDYVYLKGSGHDDVYVPIAAQGAPGEAKFIKLGEINYNEDTLLSIHALQATGGELDVFVRFMEGA